MAVERELDEEAESAIPIAGEEAPQEEEDEEELDTELASLLDSDAGETEDTVNEVFDVFCTACDRRLCQRAMRVSLVADLSVKLFSTDFRLESAEEEEAETEHWQCKCVIRKLNCAGCVANIGYHVIRPCTECACEDHNDHYWLMCGDGVRGVARLDDDGQPILWLSASTTSEEVGGVRAPPAAQPSAKSPSEGNVRSRHQGRIDAASCVARPAETGSDSAAPEAAASPQSEASENCCPICQEPLHAPYAGPCGHAVCRRCLTRAIDLRRECPLCRRPTTCSELIAVSVGAGGDGGQLSSPASSSRQDKKRAKTASEMVSVGANPPDADAGPT
eukprot:TRINITY_DN33154_c0_g1_i1.p1 TRINITY_DN33154_c0_g1~~TRINITY_DN33154_c0_g1_i1.p1  ORF type:complete len:333 (+),score=59.47 TRINITY_DN33154_c0_g1_i1:539-1537(+)